MENKKVKIYLSEIFGNYWEMINNRISYLDTKLSWMYGEEEFDCRVIENENQIDYEVLLPYSGQKFYINKIIDENGITEEIYLQEMLEDKVVGQAKYWTDNKGFYEQSLCDDRYEDGKKYHKELCHIQYSNHERERCQILVNISKSLEMQSKVVIKLSAKSHEDLNPLKVISDEARIEIDKRRLNINLKYDTMEEIIDKFNIFYNNPYIEKSRTAESVHGKVDFEEEYLQPMEFNRIPYFTAFNDARVSEHLNLLNINKQKNNGGETAGL